MDSDKLNEALSAVMQNPGLLSQIKEAAGSVNAGVGQSGGEVGSSEGEAGSVNGEDDIAKAAPPFSGDLMTQLPGIISALAPMMNGGGAPSGGTRDKPTPQKPFRHEKLLEALKPYLNDTRRDSIDKITQITKLTEVIETAAPLIMPKTTRE